MSIAKAFDPLAEPVVVLRKQAKAPQRRAFAYFMNFEGSEPVCFLNTLVKYE